MFPTTRFETLTILAIDPGLHNIGLSVFQVGLNPSKILSISAETLKSTRVIDASGLDDDDFIERVHIRYSMRSAFRHYVESVNPSLVVSESPFFDRRKPGSFAILTEIMTGLFDTVTEVNPMIRFSVLAPQLVKMVLGVAGQKGKDVVREAMRQTEPIMSVLQQPLDHLDEHSVDSTAVGYAFLLRKSGLFD